MIEDRAIAKAREDAAAAPADRWGCIRIRRIDVMNMLDVIAAQDAALDRAAIKPTPPRFFDRIAIHCPPATPRKVRG